MVVKCSWCGDELEFDSRKGWIHKGGGLYVQVCERCGWMGSLRETTFSCPVCGSELKDDHCAMPARIGCHIPRHIEKKYDMRLWR